MTKDKTPGSTGGVYRRKDSSYYWLWYRTADGKQHFQSAGTPDLTLAHVELNRVLSHLKRGKSVAKRRDPLFRLDRQLLEELSRQEGMGRKSLRTAAVDLPRVRHFIEYSRLQDIRSADDVDSEVLTGYLEYLTSHDGVGPATANRYVDAVRGLIDRKIPVKKYPDGNKIGKEIPSEIMAAFFEAADPTFRSFLILLAETGLRTGHLAAVEMAWVKLYSYKDTDGRNRKSRYIAFPPSASNRRKNAPLVALNRTAQAVIDSLPRKGRFLFDNGHGFPLYGKDRISQCWRTIKARTGLKGYRLYDFRHTWAITEIMRTGDIAYVSRGLGHSSPSTTLNYYQGLSVARLLERAEDASITGLTKKQIG